MNEEFDKKTILVVDDEINLQELIKISLKSKNYNVETANNGVEGLAKMDTVKPNLIILDMNMPLMGGLEFYQRICYGKTHPKCAILVLTARAHTEHIFKEINIDGFMTKPFEINVLLSTIESIIQKNPS